MNKTRLEAFSDGVIAIIITIMVLEMKAPAGTDWQTMKPLVPKFLSYGLSFLFVAIYWVNHHHLLHTVSSVSPAIMWANINLLFWLSLTPFATAWMGETHFDKVAVAFYAVLALLSGVAYNFLQKAIVHSHNESQDIKLLVQPFAFKEVSSIVLYALSIPVALFINPVISGVMFLTVSLIWIVPDRKITKAFEQE